ncbi:dihydrolipoyllysine-residue succinyltransferase [bacterium]|nr:dihydrolipoyllysine-residue succinyltransferase [bacterium]
MAKETVKVPSVGESVTEVTVGSFLVENGSFVEEDMPVCELESDKASVEVPAPKSGKITFSKQVGDTLAIGDVFAEIDTDAKGEAPKKEVKQEPAPALQEKEKEVSTKEKVPREDGSFVRSFLEEHIEDVQAKIPSPAPTPAPAKTKVETSKEGTSRKKMPRIRQVIAKKLVSVKNETAMLTTFNEVDMSSVMRIRSREKEKFLKKHGVKLTIMPFFMKAAAVALSEFSEVNAFIDGDEIVYNNNVHMGIAVSTDKGLVVPVIHDINTMSVSVMTKHMNALAAKGREGKLSISDMSGGTFTITNGGVFGSMLSTPILNPPQSAILGLHNIVERAVVVEGKVEVRPIMYLALSYDHRIIDGKDSVQFLVRIKELMEDPAMFMLGE